MATAEVRKRRQRQKVVASIEMVPDNFVPLASFGSRPSGGKGSEKYELLIDAYQRGNIDACKVMRTPRDKGGPVFVDAVQAAELIDADAGRISACEDARRARADRQRELAEVIPEFSQDVSETGDRPRAASASEAVRELHERIGRLLVQAIRMEMQERGK